MEAPGLRRLLTTAFAIVGVMLAATTTAPSLKAAPKVSEFKLDNGMRVIVIPDTRAPVVTHMVWYKVGAADEPPGVSGIAHFLEHLMFKSTDKIPMGEFSKIVARLGGQDNAFTSQDATAYFQRVAKERLRNVMEMEADRMVNLRLTEKEVLTERDVIKEERRSRIENSPNSLLAEQMDAALYLSHPYGIPVIGWMHEIAQLSQEDALSFYNRYYAPNNALLVVAGDVVAEVVLKLAKETYGQIPGNPAVTSERERPQEPPHLSPRRVSLTDARVGKASFHRYYLAPSYLTDEDGEAEALEVLMKVLASGSTSRLYQRLVVEKKIASSAGGWFYGGSRDSGKISLYAVAADGQTLDAIEDEIDVLIGEVQKDGLTEAEIDRAKKSMKAEFVYQTDNQASMARRYGWALTMGQTLEEIESWPDRIAKVTLEQVQDAARKHLDQSRSVTGQLIPKPVPQQAKSDEAAGAGPKG